MGLTENIRASIDGMGQVEMSGVKLESADARLLDVDTMDLDRHVAMQPSAIAYYGAMKKDAGRGVAMLKRAFDRWEKAKYAEAKAAVMSGTASAYKPTVDDIKSRFIVDNELQLEEWDRKLDKAQEELDTLDSWYEAWRQKSFALQQHVSVTGDERWSEGNLGGSSANEEFSSKAEGKMPSSLKVREMMKRHKEAGA